MTRNEQLTLAFAALGGIYLCSFLWSLNIAGLACLFAAARFASKATKERLQLREPEPPTIHQQTT